MYRHHHRRQHDGSRTGRLPGHGPRCQLLCLQEPLLCRDEEVVPGHLQELTTTTSEPINDNLLGKIVTKN